MTSYVREHHAGLALFAPADVEFEPESMVQPDLFVLPLVDGRKPHSVKEAGRLLLVVEVLSPSTARLDRHLKRRLYQRYGVEEYWIVDLDARVVEMTFSYERRAPGCLLPLHRRGWWRLL